MDLAWAAGEPGPTLDIQVLPGFRELECRAVELRALPPGAQQPHQKTRLSARSTRGKLPGSVVSKSLVPSPGSISALPPAPGARRFEAGRNPKHLARNRFQLARVPRF